MNSSTKISNLTSEGKVIRQSAESKVEWCRKAKRELVSKHTKYEKIVFDGLSKSKKRHALIQQRFELGGHIYFADIYIAKWKIIIEVDGEYHNNPERKAIDSERDRLCEAEGIRVYRITNEQVECNDTLNEFLSIINSSQPMSKSLKPLKDNEYKFLTTPNFLQSKKYGPLRILCEVNGKYKYRAIQRRKNDVKYKREIDY